jgi:ABC-2 type transport system ATP-binding protein
LILTAIKEFIIDERGGFGMASAATNTEPIVELVNVSKSYKKVQALDNVSFEIPKGSVFGYIGPNGAGKTTTIKILVGLITDFKGDVFVNGRSISKERVTALSEFGYHPQDVGFQEWRSVGQMLTTFGRLSGLPRAGLDSRINEVLELVGLSDTIQRKIVELSGGMQQKLRFAQSLLHSPNLLILDEPLSGLDPASRRQVKSIIRDLARSGITIFFSSHILSDVQDIASLIGILNNGQLMGIASPEQLQNVGKEIEVIVADGSSIALEEIPNIESVKEISSTKRILCLQSDADIDAVMVDVLRSVLSQGSRLRSLRLLTESLEDVYLRYVGGRSE